METFIIKGLIILESTSTDTGQKGLWKKLMIILGVNETSHDASISLIKDGDILFAGHAERYSKQKNDWYNNINIYKDMLNYGTPTHIAYYEHPQLKRSRIFLKGGIADWKPNIPMDLPIKYFNHHYSHASAGYYTSKFNDAVIVVLDSIGEWNTSTIWVGEGSKIKQIYKKNYPFSFGLFYSAFTKLIGLKPNEEEYIMMGMAAYGDWKRYYKDIEWYFNNRESQSYNFHKGIYDWPYKIDEQARFDIAAAVQRNYSTRLIEFMLHAKDLTGKKKLVFMGGCALNCSANTRLWEMFDDVWIMPNPGDAGSSLGAAAALYGSHLNWQGPYLGHNISDEYPVDKILNKLLSDKIAPVASGRAEYGPRALGNRSILADPRDPDIKTLVNKIKQREEFRPFAPVVLEEDASEWFDMSYSSPYMQFTPRCLKPDIVPAVVHKDGTSRVQTVNSKQHPGLYSLLLKWKAVTGIPILLNTSLNIKGQPMLNDMDDVIIWEKTYGQQIII
jgi:carbamoyltransferase